MNIRTAIIGGFLVSVLLVATLGCEMVQGPPEEVPQPEERDLRLLVSWNAPMVISPLINWPDSLSNPAVSLVYGSLFFAAEDGQMRPYLADELTVEGDSKLVLHLREDLVWHDGEPVTASDLQFTLEIMLHPDFDGGASDEFDFIAGARQYRQGESDDISGLLVQNEHSLHMQLEVETPLSPWSLASLSPVPAHKMRDIPIGQLPEYLRSERPVGAGPYVCEQMQQTAEGIRFELGRHEKFFYPDEGISRVHIELTGSAETEQWHQHYDGLYVPADEVFDRDEPEGFDSHYTMPAGYEYLGMNHRREFFETPEARRAVKLAVDERQVIEHVFGEAGEVVTFLTDPSQSLEESETLYDLPEAERLLDELGFLPGDDNWRRTEEEVPIELYLAYPSGDELRQKAAEILTKQLAEVGLRVIPAPVHRDMLLFNIYSRRVFDMYLLAERWHRSTSYSYWQSDNQWGYQGPGRRPSDKDIVSRFWDDGPSDHLPWEEELAADAPVVVLGVRRGKLVVSDQLRGVIPWQWPALGDIFTWNWSD